MTRLSLLLAATTLLCACQPAGDAARSEEATAEGGATGSTDRHSDRDPVARGAENIVIPPTANSTDLPAPANEPTSVENSARAASELVIPQAYRGRWGLVPGDCTSTRGDAKGLITIDARSIRFYESVGTLRAVRPAITTAFSGEFSFTGEGMRWERPITLQLNGNRLSRSEPAADGQTAVDLTYTACPR